MFWAIIFAEIKLYYCYHYYYQGSTCTPVLVVISNGLQAATNPNNRKAPYTARKRRMCKCMCTRRVSSVSHMFIACILKFAPKKLRASAIRQRSLHPAVCRPSPDTVLPPGGGRCLRGGAQTRSRSVEVTVRWLSSAARNWRPKQCKFDTISGLVLKHTPGNVHSLDSKRLLAHYNRATVVIQV